MLNQRYGIDLPVALVHRASRTTEGYVGGDFALENVGCAKCDAHEKKP